MDRDRVRSSNTEIIGEIMHLLQQQLDYLTESIDSLTVAIHLSQRSDLALLGEVDAAFDLLHQVRDDVIRRISK